MEVSQGMSTSLLYHAFGIIGYRYVHTYVGGRVVFRIDQDRSELSCPVCESHQAIRKGHMERRFMAVPIGR